MMDTLNRSALPMDREPLEGEASHLHVLVVDDSRVNRHVLEIFLEHLGAKSLSVENGALAVQAAARQPFDAILMDIQMPVMDGLTATREIRRQERAARRPEAPIVVISASCEPEDIVASKAAGANFHMAKPITMHALLAALSTACDPEQQQQAA